MHLSAFIHQKSYERIEYEVRKDFITTVPTIFGFLLLAAAPFGILVLLRSIAPGLLEGPMSYPALVLFASIYYLSIGLFFYTYFVTFYLDLLIVTNDRLLHIEQQGLFARTISELDLYNIQDITSEVNGFFASLFKYGSLHIQTAGAIEKFVMHNITHPEMLRQTILDLAVEDRKYHQK